MNYVDFKSLEKTLEDLIKVLNMEGNCIKSYPSFRLRLKDIIPHDDVKI